MKRKFDNRLVPQKQTSLFKGNPVHRTALSEIHSKPEERKSAQTPEILFSSCLVDHSGRQFVCIHTNCEGNAICSENLKSRESFAFHSLHFHPEDNKLLCEIIFPDILNFVSSVPETELHNYRFAFNHRCIRDNGGISQFLVEGTFLVSETEYPPVLKITVFSEIGEIKKDENMILTIFLYSAEHGYQKVFTKDYRKTGNSLLSQRELEITRLCFEGMASKTIADKLNLSIHTVKNHKRNMMEKTLTHSITELINLCIVNRWI